MSSITSYFNPISTEHHASIEFGRLNGWDKFYVAAGTFFATIATSFTFGLGGVAAFRVLTKKFTVLEINKFNASIDSTAKKTDILYMDAISNFFKSQGKSVENHQIGALKFQKDTCFEVLSTALGESEDSLLADFKKYVEDNSEKVKNYYNIYAESTLDPPSLNEFKELLICENIPQKILNEFRDSQRLEEFVWVQKEINAARCELVSSMRNVTIILHDVREEHKDILANSEINPTIPIRELVKTLGKEYSQASGAKETIEIAYGEIHHTTKGDVLRRGGLDIHTNKEEYIFIQPVLIRRGL